ncbi:MAG TPA: hypothetical protein DF699_07895 [Phycisphaerales bacterium]|nr:hypothetical protein [Phycisphaerales bacterium]
MAAAPSWLSINLMHFGLQPVARPQRGGSVPQCFEKRFWILRQWLSSHAELSILNMMPISCGGVKRWSERTRKKCQLLMSALFPIQMYSRCFSQSVLIMAVFLNGYKPFCVIRELWTLGTHLRERAMCAGIWHHRPS